ncbi:hypothetical protein [Paenibacillus albiflavus]|nr:hypothetical protein [Paenibacillus albiflavus]
MMSEEVQSSETLRGIPVHKDANKKRLQEAAEKLKETISDEKFLNERVEYAGNVLEAAYPSFSIDKKIESIVKEEFDFFMSGQKSVDEVSKLIQNRVMTYLNE